MIYQISIPTQTGMVVTLDEIKKHVAIESGETYYNDMLTSMEAAAVGWVESRARILLRTENATIYADELPNDRDPFYIPVWPVRTITTVKYRDITGTLVTITPQESLTTSPASLYPAIGEVWPETEADNKRAVEVVAAVGYSSAPEMAKHAIKMLVAHWFRNRETVLVGTISKEMEKAVDALLVQFRKNYWTPFGVFQ